MPSKKDVLAGHQTSRFDNPFTLASYDVPLGVRPTLKSADGVTDARSVSLGLYRGHKKTRGKPRVSKTLERKRRIGLEAVLHADFEGITYLVGNT
jgi:hypothetical protein